MSKTVDIPISAGEEIARRYGYDQVVIVARKVGDEGREHCTTYGIDKANCDVAARIGMFFKHELMKWPAPQPDPMHEVIRWRPASEHPEHHGLLVLMKTSFGLRQVYFNKYGGRWIDDEYDTFEPGPWLDAADLKGPQGVEG